MKTRRTLWAAILLALLGAWLPVASQTPATVPVRVDKRQGTAPSSFAEARAYNPAIPNMVSEVNTPAVMATIRQLEGFQTRYAPTANLEVAGDYLYNAFGALGLQVEKDPFTFGTGSYPTSNIVATLPGRTDPSTTVIVGAHYDSTSDNQLVLAPGADDNASGTAVVLELARVLRNYEFDFTIKFIAFSAEERRVQGSTHYASRARSTTHENILGMVNLDMVGYVDREPEDLDLIANGPSEWLADLCVAAAARYAPLPTLKIVNDSFARSDNAAFWNNGYSAVCAIEDFAVPNPHYHTTHDTSSTLNAGFLGSVAKAGVAAVATIAQPVSDPAAPTNLAVSPRIVRGLFIRATLGSLTWNPPPSQAVGYNVYRSAAGRRIYQSINRSPLTGTSFVDRTIPSAGTYYYVVRTVDASGREGNASAPAALTVVQ